MNCMDVMSNLTESVRQVNTELTDHMTRSNVSYKYVCVKPDATFDYFFNSLKVKWEKIINEYMDAPITCKNKIQGILIIIEALRKMQNLNSSKSGDNENTNSLNEKIAAVIKKLESITVDDVKTLAYNAAIDKAIAILKSKPKVGFVLEPDITISLKKIASIMAEHCQCHLTEIFMYIVEKYKTRYAIKLENKDREESIAILKADYEYIKKFIESFGNTINFMTGNTFRHPTENIWNMNKQIINPIKQIKKAKNMLSFMNFSIETELEKLIPNEIGTMKAFFIKVISRYYNNLHPIVWTQIFRGIIDNLFKDLPATLDEIFSFVSKYVLLNSGPFILKILQMIRPILSEELAKKYNLTKLTYPLLEKNQTNMILERVLNEKDMTKIIYNKSASVGHVCIGYNVKNPNEKFVIKIIKPLAIAQSCWEYKVLSDLFPKDSCEDKFIKNTLRANGHEMNVENEIANLAKGNEYYTSDYKSEFGLDINAKLRSISNIPNIIRDGSWYALAMTLAPGMPLADLIETNIIQKDTKFRANIHRCLDVLVAKFFFTMVNHGFYHGDLHAGNIFYSYKQKQITLIDFGAVGNIDLFANDDTSKTLIHIVIKSLYYDFSGIFDILTDVLNGKCITDNNNVQINKDTEEYNKFKRLLTGYQIKNIIYSERESETSKDYIIALQSDQRLKDEYVGQMMSDINADNDIPHSDDSIYDYLDIVPEEKETVVENRDLLPSIQGLEKTKQLSVSFASVMQQIIKFYAEVGVNVAVKFAELNELQKAYALLLGVLAKTEYSSYRMNMAIRSGIVRWQSAGVLTHPKTVIDVAKTYWEESSEYNKIKDRIFKKVEEKTKESIKDNINNNINNNIKENIENIYVSDQK